MSKEDLDQIKFVNNYELEQVEKYGYVVVGDSAKRAKEIHSLIAELDALEAERAELRRRLDAIMDECFCTREVCARTVLAIAEGRDNGA